MASSVARHSPLRRTIICSALAAPWAQAATSDDGRPIAEAFANRPQGRDLTAVSRMELGEPGRSPRTRRFVSYKLTKGPGTSSYLLRFLAPRDIAGVGLLNLPRDDGEADQWLFLPEMDRVRRISSDRKGGRFVGSTLYYEDLRERRPADDRHRVIGQEAIAGVACDVVESTPIDPASSVYRSRTVWIDRESKLALRIDYFEVGDKPSKRWTAGALKKVQGYWTVIDSTMSDLAEGGTTRLFVETALYDRKLPSRLFTTNALGDEQYESEYRP